MCCLIFGDSHCFSAPFETAESPKVVQTPTITLVFVCSKIIADALLVYTQTPYRVGLVVTPHLESGLVWVLKLFWAVISGVSLARATKNYSKQV